MVTVAFASAWPGSGGTVATGAVTGLLKSVELLLVSVQLAVRITERAFAFVPETAIGAVSEQLAVVP